ncbi:M56 family metallopeptidase [Sphingomonas sabuli]|uniref:M56 family metallopeptidase n=1 Tax=Sphingomonas sabuli TaxID=2764186 RepID=A0A7G9L3K6_9SPHN|nr:M56 family metallopeptidase [Sphingomonas sabuli]QNM83205.1 M56 family metallopeptidase [Sphingomonas sabuli]
MAWFIPFALKSLLFAGGALLLLRLLKGRSAADRSWIAHLALAGLLLLPLFTFALPTLDVTGPEFLVGTEQAPSPAPSAVTIEPDTSTDVAPVAANASAGSASIDWSFWAYAAPAALLVLLTLIALARLFVLKARATVLVDAPWLTALARAQSRMGFKHGTALLTSNALPSPISWGVVRPVILLNEEASQSPSEAEAIITHELAHVANLDWAKLLIARVATALFWFNPFVWLLAREAHQLREEAADDAVLATDIDETDYARLLVGVARHECRGFLIGAHGVAPGRNSLSRRVRRVLDGAVKRAPGGWRWGSAAAFFAAGMAVPVAALNLVPAASATASPEARVAGSSDGYYGASRDNIRRDQLQEFPFAEGTKIVKNGSTIETVNGQTVMTSSNGSTITIAAPDANGRRRTVLKSADGNVLTLSDAGSVPGLAGIVGASPRPRRAGDRDDAIDRAIELKGVGVTPEYLAAIRSAAPQLRLDHDGIVSLKAVGVSPAFIQELARLGYRAVDADDIAGAYAVGVREDYVRDLAAAGYGRLTMDQLTELKAVGVTAQDIRRFRGAGYKNLDVDTLVELKALGVSPEELKASQNFDP